MAVSKSASQELEKLRAENARLKAANAKLEKKAATHSSMASKNLRPSKLLRSLSVIVLAAAAVALLTAGNLLFWLGNTIVKPDRFTAATQPIIKDPNVQQTLALYTTNNIFKNVDVQKITEEVLPPKAVFLAPQLTSQLKSTTQKTLQNTLAKPSFQEKWNNVLATQHERLVSFASRYNGDGAISLNDVYNQLSASLGNTKLAFLSNKKLPPKVGSITLLNASWLPAFHNVVVNIDTWRLLAVTAFLLCVIAAVWLSKNRRKTLYIISAGAAFFMVLTLVALRITRETIVQKADPQYADGVRSAVQIFFHPLVLQTATVLFAFVLVAFVAWVSGPVKSAAVIRSNAGLLFSGKLHIAIFGNHQNKYISWIHQNKSFLEWAAIALITIIMLIVRVTLKSLILYAFLMLASVLVIETIAGTTSPKKRIT
jgi:hypothetical protein